MAGEMVSVVMATYNGEKFLRQQLDSILEQTYQNLEVIVVDDVSTDRTLAILAEYAALDDRVHVFPAENNFGFVKNFERGLILANGTFVALSDQDDIFRPDKIELMVNALKANLERDLVLSDLSLIDENGNNITQSMWCYAKLDPQQGKPFRRLLYRNFATGCAMMIRRRLLEFAIPFPPDCIAHDWWLAVVAASSKAGGICLIDEQLTAYRQHSSNVLGAKEAVPVRVGAILPRIKALPRGRVIFDRRMSLYKPDLDRLTGYLESTGWAPKDRLIIEQSRALFVNYMNDAHSNLIGRILKLPQRLRHALIVGGVASCLTVVMHTITPYK